MLHLFATYASSIGLFLLLTMPVRAQFGLEELAKGIEATAVTGKAGSSFILNRGLGETVPVNDGVKRLAEALGFVSADGSIDPVCISVPWGKDWLTTIKKLHQDGKLKSVAFIDVGSPVAVIESEIAEAWLKNKENYAAFRDYLKNHQVDAKAAGLTSINDAKLMDDKCTTAQGYLSSRFIIHQAMEQLRLYQLELTRLKPELSFGGPYAGNFDRNADALILEAWRTKALIPWVAERSWMVGEYSPQALGYYLALARSAESKKPIICDLHVGTGNYPIGIRRSFYLGLAHGAKAFRFVGAIPPSMAQDKEGLAMTSDTWKTLRELTHEAGQFASVMSTAKPKASDVGILVSKTQSLWDPSAWVSEEGKAIFHAARASGHNISIVTEEDVQEGRFQKLATIFVLGTHLQRDTAKALKGWVKNGAVISCIGGPYLDEFNQPLTDMLELQGITEAKWQPLEKAGAAKIALAQIKPTDNITFTYMNKKYNFPVVYGKLKITSDEKQKDKYFVMGTYKDGTTAVVKHEYEPTTLGHVWCFGSPMGSGWLKTTLPGQPWKVDDKPNSYNHQILFKMLEGDAGDVVIAATGDARFDVITDNLSVESVLLENPNNCVMVSINWSNKPEEAWLTAQFIPKGMDRVRSLSQGPLNSQRAGVTVSLPRKFKVNVADILVFE